MKVDSIVGIIGWPVSHSISPLMHNHAFAHLGLTNWYYAPMPVALQPSSRIKDAVLGLRALGFKGANVTVPYKEAVMPFMDKLSDEAVAIGAINTIVVDKQGMLCGYNTDAPGFIADVLDHGVTIKNREALVLGAGGSCRGVVFGLLNAGCKKITILNRTESKAHDIIETFKPRFKDATMHAGLLDHKHLIKASAADIVINTTSLGLSPHEQDMPWDEDIAFHPGQLVYDLIYNPKETKLLQHAKKSGAKALNGLGMLAHQGALAFSLWTGQKAPVALMKDYVLSLA